VSEGVDHLVKAYLLALYTNHYLVDHCNGGVF